MRANMPFTMLTKNKKAKIIKEVQVHATDTGSPEVQVAVLTRRIEELTGHLKKHKKDNHSRRGLLQMVADRQAHMKYLAKASPKRHAALAKKIERKK
jgi:small subunit ribosomal protein S15